MVNSEEFAICKRRGHDFNGFNVAQKWRQCKWCGTWAREVRTLEERDSKPPADDLDPLEKLRESSQEGDSGES